MSSVQCPAARVQNEYVTGRVHTSTHEGQTDTCPWGAMLALRLCRARDSNRRPRMWWRSLMHWEMNWCWWPLWACTTQAFSAVQDPLKEHNNFVSVAFESRRNLFCSPSASIWYIINVPYSTPLDDAGPLHIPAPCHLAYSHSTNDRTRVKATSVDALERPCRTVFASKDCSYQVLLLNTVYTVFTQLTQFLLLKIVPTRFASKHSLHNVYTAYTLFASKDCTYKVLFRTHFLCNVGVASRGCSIENLICTQSFCHVCIASRGCTCEILIRTQLMCNVYHWIVPCPTNVALLDPFWSTQIDKIVRCWSAHHFFFLTLIPRHTNGAYRVWSVWHTCQNIFSHKALPRGLISKKVRWSLLHRLWQFAIFRTADSLAWGCLPAATTIHLGLTHMPVGKGFSKIQSDLTEANQKIRFRKTSKWTYPGTHKCIRSLAAGAYLFRYMILNQILPCKFDKEESDPTTEISALIEVEIHAVNQWVKDRPPGSLRRHAMSDPRHVLPRDPPAPFSPVQVWRDLISFRRRHPVQQVQICRQPVPTSWSNKLKCTHGACWNAAEMRLLERTKGRACSDDASAPLQDIPIVFWSQRLHPNGMLREWLKATDLGVDFPLSSDVAEIDILQGCRHPERHLIDILIDISLFGCSWNRHPERLSWM